MRMRGTMAAVVLAIVACVPVRGADRITLRSGADFLCDHQKSVDGRVRIYFTPAEDSYLDVNPQDIVSRETNVAVPVAAVAAPTQKVQAAAGMEDIPTLLHAAGTEHHIDPDLLASVVRAESGGQTHAMSRVGAQGLMQLMPRTAADLGVRDSFAADQNIAGGTTYLDALLMYYHDDVALALAAYNAGPAAVARYHGIPPYTETRRYVARIIHDYNRRKMEEMREQHAHRLPTPVIAAAVPHP